MMIAITADRPKASVLTLVLGGLALLLAFLLPAWPALVAAGLLIHLSLRLDGRARIPRWKDEAIYLVMTGLVMAWFAGLYVYAVM